MSKAHHNPWLNTAAFLLPLFAGYVALTADAFLFLALFCISAFASLFKRVSSNQNSRPFLTAGLYSWLCGGIHHSHQFRFGLKRINTGTISRCKGYPTASLTLRFRCR
jgi:hypothetical protein